MSGITLEPGECRMLGLPAIPEDHDWPLRVWVSWSGRGSDIMLNTAACIRWTRLPASWPRRLGAFLTGHYRYEFEGWPA
jgi:hypothetical protein